MNERDQQYDSALMPKIPWVGDKTVSISLARVSDALDFVVEIRARAWLGGAFHF